MMRIWTFSSEDSPRSDGYRARARATLGLLTRIGTGKKFRSRVLTRKIPGKVRARTS